jgi:hypothetical protein
MKNILFFGIAALVFWACSTGKEASRSSVSLSRDGQDSTEYEILIIDPGFDQWYALNYSPAKDYMEEYYHGKNILAAARWNEYYLNGRYRNVVASTVDYRPEVDYGMEVNRTLYWYFRYAETTYQVPLFE